MAKPRKKKSKIYFGTPAQDAIIEYNASDDPKERNLIYKDRIQFPFEKLAENILNTFKFSYFDVSKEDVKKEESDKQKKYQAFFQKALKKFGVDSPAELEGDKKKEFFDYIDKNYEATDESVKEDVRDMKNYNL